MRRLVGLLSVMTVLLALFSMSVFAESGSTQCFDLEDNDGDSLVDKYGAVRYHDDLTSLSSASYVSIETFLAVSDIVYSSEDEYLMAALEIQCGSTDLDDCTAEQICFAQEWGYGTYITSGETPPYSSCDYSAPDTGCVTAVEEDTTVSDGTDESVDSGDADSGSDAIETEGSSSSSSRPTMEELYDDGILEIAHSSSLLDECQLFVARNSYLDSDLDCTGMSPGPVFSFMLDDLTLDCQGHTIYGDGNWEALYAGFFFPFLGYYPLNDITIQNCRFEGFGYGVVSEENSGLTLENVEFVGIANDAVYLSGADDVMLDTLSVSESGTGINVEGGSSFTLVDSNIQDNFFGIGVTSASEHIVRNSVISNNVLENVHLQNVGTGGFYSNVMCGSRIDFYCNDADANLFSFEGNFVDELRADCISNVVSSGSSSGDMEVEYFSLDSDFEDLPSMQRLLSAFPSVLSGSFTLDFSTGSSYSGLLASMSSGVVADTVVDTSLLESSTAATGPLVDVSDLAVNTELNLYEQFLETQIASGASYADMVATMGLSGLSVTEATQALVQTTGDAALAAGIMDTYLSSGGVSGYEVEIATGLSLSGATGEEVASALAATGATSTTVQSAVNDAGIAISTTALTQAVSSGSALTATTTSMVQSASVSQISTSVSSSLASSIAASSTGVAGMAVASSMPSVSEIAAAGLAEVRAEAFDSGTSARSASASSSSSPDPSCNDNEDNNADGRYDFYGACFDLSGNFVHGFADVTPPYVGTHPQETLERWCEEGASAYGFPGGLVYVSGDQSCSSLSDDSEIYFPSMQGNNVCDESAFCYDGIDNDADGLVDCMDPDCTGLRCHAEFNDYTCQQNICSQVFVPEATQATVAVEETFEFLFTYQDFFTWLENAEVHLASSSEGAICDELCANQGKECLFAEAGRSTCSTPGSHKCTCA